MRKHTKQILALILAVCSLVTFAMPTVFAVGEQADPEVAPESVTYQFYRQEWADEAVASHTAQLKSDYEADASNWRYEAIFNAYQFRPYGGNAFVSGLESIEFLTAAQQWVAVRIQSPGAGRYDLTFTHGVWSEGAATSSVYIVEAKTIDNALGANKDTYAEAMAQDPYQNNGTTDAFLAYQSAVTNAIVGKTPIIEPSFYAETSASGATDTGSFVFKADTEYVVVFKADSQAPGASTARILLGSLSTKYSADQSIEETHEPVVYPFYNALWNETPLADHTEEIKNAYDEGMMNWRYEAISTVYQFRPLAGQNKVTSGLESVEIVCADGSWFAVRIQSPGTGYYDLTLNHGVMQTGALKSSVYILDGAEVDAALGGNAASYAHAMSQDPYQNDGQTEAFQTYWNVINTMIGRKRAVMNPIYHAAAVAVNGVATGRYAFEKDKEYVLVFRSDAMATGESTARIFLGSLVATYSENQIPDEEPEETVPDTPILPEIPAYTDGLYDFYAGKEAGDTLGAGLDTIAALYDAGSLNWKYETHSGMRLDRTSYESSMSSMRFISSDNWWIAFRIKAPSVDGSYNIQMTHGANGEGSPTGNIYVIPGDTAAKDIVRVMNRKGPAMTTDWFYGENVNDWIAGRQTSVGTVNMEAGKEYIVIFLPTGKSPINGNGYIFLGQLQATRVGDLVEEEDGGDGSSENFYEFYDWDNPGNFLIHYRTEEELGAKIVTDKIAQEYADGTRNWRYEKSNGFAYFSTGTPFMETTIGETNCFALRIKSPGTGTFSIEYTHYMTNDDSAGKKGYVYVVPVPDKEYDYGYIEEECKFKDPIITTTYQSAQTGLTTVTGTYNSFEAGKEYLICFAVADDDNTQNLSLKAYLVSMQMTRIGDWQPEPGNEPDDGIVYNLFREEYTNKTLWHGILENEKQAIQTRFENGTINWMLEGLAGSAYYGNRYLRAGVGSSGGAMALRIKAPGTGKYQVTLKYFLGSEVTDADSAEVYVVEAPEEYLDIAQVSDKMARAPIMTTVNSHNGLGMKKATGTGTYSFEAGKEYYVIIYMTDVSDAQNTSGSCWIYLDRLVMKRIGEFEPEEEHFTVGGVVVKDAVRLFRTSDALTISEVNGHDYLTLTIFGSTMMIYDLDEWRLVDEVYTGIPTPRGVTVDNDGNIWVVGDVKTMYCYNPYTLTGFSTDAFLLGGSAYQMCTGEDGYLYFSTMSDESAYVYRFDPKTQDYTVFRTKSWSSYAADMAQKGDYIYLGASGEERHEVLKMNKYTGQIVDSVDITKEMKTTRYITGMDFLDENYLWVSTMENVTVIDIRTMEKLPQEQIGVGDYVVREISGEIDGKRYFVTLQEGLCYYDIATQTFGVVGGDLKNAKTGIRGKNTNLATIDDSRLPGKSIITYGGMTEDGLNLYAYNPESKQYVTLIGLVEPAFAYGQDLREMGVGLPGSGEIYFGANYDSPIQVYNTLDQELKQSMATNGQADAFHWYKDQLYIGNYNGAMLTRMENGEPIPLFRLNDDNFFQARIHSITSGDDKVFVGTLPNVYQNGGTIAWYDLNTELTYVVTGPNPEDVYYAKASKVTVTNEWYSAVTGERVDIQKEWDKDEDGDGACKYFKGPVPLQSITKVVYRDGLLFGLAAPMGGTSAVNPAGETAKIFIYDVENMKMLKTIDIGDYISGVPSPLFALAAFEGDPDISNKFWGVVSETLFSMTYDFDTGKITIKAELSFDRDTIKHGNGWFTNDMIFQDDYIYVMFDKIGGLCRVNRNNPKEYEQLLYNFDSVSQMPSSFALSDDGDLYYIAGTSLYVLNLDITEEERAEAKNVQDLIDLISDTVTLADRPAIEAARAAWDAMAPANQPLVKNYEKLEEAEIELLRLRIADLGEITIEDEPELVSIRKTYSTLTLEQRMSLDFLTVSKAESIMSILRGERMVKMIDAIGEVTLEKEAVVRDARASFMALTLYERRLVTNIDVLNAAEAVLTTLLLQKSEAGAVDALIEKIGFVFFGDGAKISAARKAYNKLSNEAKDLVENHTTLVLAEIILVVEYVVAAAAVTGGVLYAIPATRAKIFKKKAKVTEE